jgi:hypothetical protein
MLATNGPRWYDHRPESNWSSFAVSLAVTVGLFVAAITSMRTVSSWIETRSAERDVPTVVHLDPPVTVPVPQPKPIATHAPVAAPTVTPKTIDIAPSVAAPISTPTTIAPVAPVAPRDTARGIGSTPVIPLGPVGVRSGGDTLVSNLRGAPILPAGVTPPAKVPNTAETRDSIAQGVMADARLWLTDKYKPKGAELAALQASQRVADRMARRTTSAGAWQDVHVPMGEGLGGVGAVNGGKSGVHMTPNGAVVSVPFPLLSSGPSPEERKRNEKLMAEYQGYLHRMGDRVLLRADSVRADSLRRDSIAKAQKAPRTPKP